MKRKRENDKTVSVINYYNRFLIILNPKSNITLISLKNDFEGSYELPKECIDDYPNRFHVTPLISDEVITNFVFSHKNRIFLLNAERQLKISRQIKSKATVLALIAFQLPNRLDFSIFSLTAHEKKFRLESRLFKNLEVVKILNILSFDDFVELLDIQFIENVQLDANYGFIFILYRIKQAIEYTIVAVGEDKLEILAQSSIESRLKTTTEYVYSSTHSWFFCSKKEITVAKWDESQFDLTFEKHQDFDGNFFLSHDIWGNYSVTGASIQLYKFPKIELLDECIRIDDNLTNAFGYIDGNDILLLIINLADGNYKTIRLNSKDFKLSSASRLKKASFSFDNNSNLDNLDISKVEEIFKLETTRDEDAVIILLKDPELYLPLFIEHYRISYKHLRHAFKKHITQKSFDIIIEKLMKWLSDFMDEGDKEFDIQSRSDSLAWVRRVIELTCYILDSTVNSKISIDATVIDELSRLTKDVCKLQRNLQLIYTRVIMLDSSHYYDNVKKYNSNKLLETFSIDL